MQRRRLFFLLVGFWVTVIGCCALSQTGSLPLPPISPGVAIYKDVPLKRLLLQSSDMPFVVGATNQIVGDKVTHANADENLIASYNNLVAHTVLRFKGDRRAHWEYLHSIKGTYLAPTTFYGKPPTNFAYANSQADEWYVACEEACEAVMRYGEIVSILTVKPFIKNDPVFMCQFQQLMEAIDQRMSLHSKKFE